MFEMVQVLGVAGVLAWYLYYTTSVSFPRIVHENFQQFDKIIDRQERMAEKQNATVERVCQEFTLSLRDERNLRSGEMAMLRAEIEQIRRGDECSG